MSKKKPNKLKGRIEMENNGNAFGKYFSWIAWFLALVITGFAFQSYLDKQYNPNQSPDYVNQANGIAEVPLRQNRHGHYVANGRINNIPVTFLLDTGATQVSIPAHLANELNLYSGNKFPVQTANGTVLVSQTSINSLSLGGIHLKNVSANINPGMKSDEILLGMSALKRVEFTQRGRTLILRGASKAHP